MVPSATRSQRRKKVSKSRRLENFLIHIRSTLYGHFAENREQLCSSRAKLRGTKATHRQTPTSHGVVWSWMFRTGSTYSSLMLLSRAFWSGRNTGKHCEHWLDGFRKERTRFPPTKTPCKLMTLLSLITLSSTFLLMLFRHRGHSCCLVVPVSSFLPKSEAPSCPLRKNPVFVCFAGPATTSSPADYLPISAKPPILFHRRRRLSPQSDWVSPCQSRVPPATWCLIDFNLDVSTVPTFIQDLGLFIVQSSSPRQDHLEWTKKQSRATMEYFLKPWTLSELLVGYGFHLCTLCYGHL